MSNTNADRPGSWDARLWKDHDDHAGQYEVRRHDSVEEAGAAAREVVDVGVGWCAG